MLEGGAAGRRGVEVCGVGKSWEERKGEQRFRGRCPRLELDLEHPCSNPHLAMKLLG